MTSTNYDQTMTAWVSFLSLFVFLMCHITRHEASDPTYQGRYTRGTGFSGGYEIVIPRKVNSDGKFVSYQIPHHFERSSYEGRRRTKRTADDGLHYRVRIDGTEHHIELYPNRRLVAPVAVVEEHAKSNGGEDSADDEDFLDNVKLRQAKDAECHYQGRVRDQPGNSALSTCYGLVCYLDPFDTAMSFTNTAGYIRTKRSWYTIEPVAGHEPAKEAEHPHIVYKRSPREFGTRAEFVCNVTGNLAKTIAKRSLKPRGSLSLGDGREENGGKGGKRTYTIELLVVLEKTVLDYYRQWDVENYALTLLNMAAGLFRDESLGVEVELAVVRIIRLEVEDDEINLSANKDAETTLKRFQEWQRLINPGDDSHPNHHDCAVLISRVDICVTQNLCGFTGASTVAGTCDPLMGAVVVKDNGLQTGYHIAHHIGHTVGMSHDEEAVNGCAGITRHRDGYVETTVMHPGDQYVTKKWSRCSRNYLKSYIDSGMAFCLEDEPQDHHFPSVEMLPGVLYDGDDQCRLRYRQDVRQCDLGITCESLRCAVPGKGCVSGRKPPAEGTPCGEKRWCYQMKCLMIGERPGAIDGGWSSWSAWSRCSRTCGSGVASSVRKCNRPTPSKGGKYCTGDRKRHKICATDPCDVDAPSFRDVQCAEFNDWIFPEDRKMHQWVAYNLPENLRASENPCALFCLSETKLVTSLRPKVVDGTTCYRGIRDICIGGECKEIPCDLNMESTAVEDVCGICKGDSTACILKEGTAMFEAGSQPKKVTDVPMGSRNIRVEETEPTTSRIMVQNKRTKAVLIDGNRLGMFDVPGSKAWLGMIRARQEALNIPGPVAEDLVILVSPKENVTLKFSLGLKQQTPRKAEFLWSHVDWEKCSAACGLGEQVSKPRCVEKIGGLVDDSFCKGMRRPDVKVRSCNQAPCVPRWMISDWQGCTPCVTGCKRTRAAKCVRPVGRGEQDVDVIADSYCQGPKPRESELCSGRRRRGEEFTRDFHEFGKRTGEDSDDERERSRRSADDVVQGHGKDSMNLMSADDVRDEKRVRDDENGSAELMEIKNFEKLRWRGVEDDEKWGENVYGENSGKSYYNGRIRRNNVDLRKRFEKKREGEELNGRIELYERPNTLVEEYRAGLKRGSDAGSGESEKLTNLRQLSGMRRNKVENAQTSDEKLSQDENSSSTYRVDRGQVVIDKEDVNNLTLTIIIERDEENRILNFPKDFKPQPPENSTDFTLVGMDAVRYIQRIQQEARSLS